MEMKYRPVDADGDMLPVSSGQQLLSGTAAVMAAVHSRLRLLSGEWWEDASLGFAVPQFLFDGVRTPAGAEMLVNYISAYVRQTPGVESITNVSSEIKNRTLIYKCTVVTADGTAEGRVTGDVLLRAIS